MKVKIAVVCMFAALAAFCAGISFADTSLDYSIKGENVKIGDTKYYTGDVTVSFDARAGAKIESAKLIINGKTADKKDYAENDFSGGEYKKSNFLTAKDSFLSENEKEGYLYEGKLVIVSGGESIEKSFEFYADSSKPEIKIRGSENEKAYNKELQIEYAAEDKNTDNLKVKASLYRNGEAVYESTSPKGKCDANLPGKYKMIVSASGIANANEKEI